MSYFSAPASAPNGEAAVVDDQVIKTEPDAKIPRFDLTKDPETLRRGSEQWKLTSREIREALETHGYLLVRYDAISDDDKGRLFEAMRSLFDLPAETKRRNEKSKYTMSVYEGDSPALPLYQSIGVINAMEKDKAEAFTRLMWPHGNDHFCEALNSMCGKTLELSRVLTNMVLDSYGLGKYSESLMGTSHSLFQMIKYAAAAKEGPALGLPNHADINYLTVLGQNEVAGLTITTKEGDLVSVDPGLNHFVVLAGQSLRAWSNGRVHPPFHQVRAGGKKDRLTYAQFLAPKHDHFVEAPPEMVDDEHPRQFRPYAYRDIYKLSRDGGTSIPNSDALLSLAGVHA